MAKDKTERNRSWFCVLNNPEEHFPELKDFDCEQKLVFFADRWQSLYGDNCSCAFAYCISAAGLNHIHAILENPNKASFNQVKLFWGNKAHIETTKGTKKQAEDYLYKRGAFQEKGEKILFTYIRGEILGRQGYRRDLEVIEDLINEGKTPKEIFRMSFSYRKYDKMIREAYYQKRLDDTPAVRDVKVIYHVGASGSGKSYIHTTLPQDDLYIYTDYEGGGLDTYCGERILFMDEFRGQLKYNVLLTMLQGYKQQVHARYTNAYTLWDEVHITSVIPPEQIYQKMIKENDRAIDTFTQLRRRISEIWYHYKTEAGEYKIFKMSMNDYIDYSDLVQKSEEQEKKDKINLPADLIQFLDDITIKTL